MELSANFAFLKQEFPFVAESASLSERHVNGDPRASCFHGRHALERLVMRIYKVDKSLEPNSSTSLGDLIYEPAFLSLIPEVVWQKINYIRGVGNSAVHGRKTPNAETARALLEELYHVLYWTGRTYLRKGAEQLKDKVFDAALIPEGSPSDTPSSLEELEKIKDQLDAAEDAKKEVQSELAKVRAELEAIKAENAKVAETHDWNERETRLRLIDVELNRVGWLLNQQRDCEYEVTGMPNTHEVGYADYVLWGDDSKPLAVIEAKKTTVSETKGKQQAKLYADCLEKMHGQRPVIFYTNGYSTQIWDDTTYPPRNISGFLKKAELETLIRRRDNRKPLDVTKVKDAIVERYYQKRAIGSICEHFSQKHRKALLVMATGSGKTRTAIALVDLLQQAGWVKRVLFLADRKALVRQAVNAFKEHLPSSSPVNLVTEKNSDGRVYVSTYQTMMGMIDDTDGNEARFGPGHFDLVIIDEAHRSVYQKYGAIFRYFDSLLVGLTATPRDQVDRNTYALFGLQPGMPTDAYDLQTAVTDGFLVPAKVQRIDLRFPRDGIDYDKLSEEEQEEWENTDWGDDANGGGIPQRVNAQSINNWLFNANTVDKVLQHLMEHGNKVDGGDRLAKTIIFARNHDHAEFIQERFDHHYPHYKGHFARVIDHYNTYAHTLIESFEQKNSHPHIAISVDMLDTGIDIPEVANLAFFKPVYSKIKFWQMIGRGTRLCPDLFGPDDDKVDFRVFDFCFNFARFNENPDGIEGSEAVPLGTQLFRRRVQLLGELRTAPELDEDQALADAVTSQLHGEVTGMNRDNFIVRERLEHVHKFQDRKAWNQLSEDDRDTLQRHIAGLPTELELDEIECRQFDLIALRMQLAVAQGDHTTLESRRQRVVELASLLEEKDAIPAVLAQLEYLASIQDPAFWDGINLAMLEDMRLRMRGLMPFLDRKKKKIVRTDFEDEVVAVHDDGLTGMPSMTGAEYEKKVTEYIRNHENHIAIHRLRSNKPLTPTDLESLETTLKRIGNEDGDSLLSSLLSRREAPTIGYFVRTIVGMDRRAAQAAFSQFLNDRSLSTNQIRFIELLVEQLTSRGVIEASALYKQPFINLHDGGPDVLFADHDEVISGIFDQLKVVNSHALPMTGTDSV